MAVFGRELARISHQSSTTTGDVQKSVAFAPFGVLDGLSSTTPRPSGRNSNYANGQKITVDGTEYSGEYRVDGSLREPLNDEGYYYIYGVDVETGHILFKSEVDGQVPTTLSGSDADIDGFVDTLYWGTTAGKVYRMEIGKPGPISATAYGDRIGAVTVDSVTYWQPAVLFDAGPDQPFFSRPSLVQIAAENRSI